MFTEKNLKMYNHFNGKSAGTCWSPALITQQYGDHKTYTTFFFQRDVWTNATFWSIMYLEIR